MNPTNRFLGQRVILGVTGGIACYKACEVARELGRRGATVQVVMTDAATAFVTPLTFQALTGRLVRTSLLDPAAEAGMGHIELARWADLIVVAPCSANTLAHLAHGQAPDLLSTLWLASSAPKAIAPAMNQAMWADPMTAENVALLAKQGHLILGPASGAQACGDVGPGRMLEPLELIDALDRGLSQGALAGRTVVVTAGPTHEPIDPVRYLANRSSGKMGFAMAQAAQRQGAQVVLITGPVALATPPGVHRVSVETAEDMLQAVHRHLQGADWFIGAAAVCDVRPAAVATQKLKKQTGGLAHLDLVENPDIIHAVTQAPNRPALVVGFAAETDALVNHATDKLHRKGLDAIVANDVSNGQVFGQDHTACRVIDHSGAETSLSGSKEAVADALITHLLTL